MRIKQTKHMMAIIFDASDRDPPSYEEVMRKVILDEPYRVRAPKSCRSFKSPLEAEQHLHAMVAANTGHWITLEVWKDGKYVPECVTRQVQVVHLEVR